MAAAERFAMRGTDRPLIGRLREQLRATEAAMGLDGPAPPLALGIPAIDAALGGGLSRGALHEIAAAREADTAAATGFALGLAAGGGKQSTNSPQARSSSMRPLPLRERAAPMRPHILMGEEWRHDTPHPSEYVGASALPSPARGEGAITRTPTRGCDLPDSGAGATWSRAAVVWIADDLTLAEYGAPYGPGLDATGLAPERLITVTAARPRDVLWAMEEALRCSAIDLVIGEIRAREIDSVATRRLSLAAAAGNTLGLLLRPSPGEDTSAAATRWIVASAPAVSHLPSPERGGSDCHRQSGEGARLTQHGRPPPGAFGADLPLSGGGERWSVGPPRLAAQLTRNRRGPLGTWIVEWNRTEQRYGLASANPQPLAFTTLDRSHPASVA